MREILFRGKRIDNGEWIEGSLVVAGDYCCILPAVENSVHPTDYPYLDSETGTIDGHLIPVDPSTVGQYTGLTDKNGKKIFEGDILENVSHDGKNFREIGGKLYGDEVVYKSRGFVYYDEKVGGFCVKYETEEDGVLDENLHQDYLGYAMEIGDGGFLEEFDEDYCIEGTVIIGNIMDNPELLRNPELLEDKS